MNEKTKKTESGRTMVEMLGTLAIIGILSIGGVTGYGRAINAHRTNTAVETAQREAMIVAGELATSHRLETGSATAIKSPTGYEVAVKDAAGGTTDITTATPFFGVEIGGGNGQAVPRAVAKSVVERAVADWKNVHGIGVISGSGSGRTIKWLKSEGTGENGFETEVPESAQTVIIIVVYASNLAPRIGDLLTEFNVTPVDPTPATCPTGTSENGSGAEATTLSNGTVCRCDGDGEEYRNGKCVTCQTYATYESTLYNNVPEQELCCKSNEHVYCQERIAGTCNSWGCCSGDYIEAASSMNAAPAICCAKGQTLVCTTELPFGCVEYGCEGEPDEEETGGNSTGGNSGGTSCNGTTCGNTCCPSTNSCVNGQCCEGEHCCPAGERSFCYRGSTNCTQYACAPVSYVLSDWADVTDYRIACDPEYQIYCSWALFADGAPRCYEWHCCDGTVVDARDQATLSGTTGEGSCQH